MNAILNLVFRIDTFFDGGQAQGTFSLHHFILKIIRVGAFVQVLIIGSHNKTEFYSTACYPPKFPQPCWAWAEGFPVHS